MKRLFSSFLVLLVVLNFVFIPVSAASFDLHEARLNVLDFDMPNDSSTSFVYNIASGDEIKFTLPQSIDAAYVDAVVQIYSLTPSAVQVGVAGDHFIDVSFEHIGGSYYRIYGRLLNYITPDLIFKFTFPSGKTTVNFVSVYMSHVKTTQYADVGGIWVAQNGGSIQYMVDSSTPLKVNFPYIFDPDALKVVDSFNGAVYLTSWRKYDFISVRLGFSAIELKSFEVYLNDVPIPFEINFLEGNSSDFNSGLGTDPDGGTVIVPSKRLFYADIFIDLRSLDRTVSSSVMIAFSGSYTPSLTQCDVTLKDVIGYIEDFSIDSDIYFFKNIWNSIKSGFSSVVSSLSSLKSQTITNTNNLISAIKGDSSAGDSYNDKVQTQVGDLESASNELNKLEKPDITGDVFDLSGEVNNSDILLLTSGIRAGLDVPLIRIIFVFALTFCLASFVLYGKK